MKWRLLLLAVIAMLSFSCQEKNDNKDLIENLKIKVDKTNITADGEDVATLSVTSQTGADQTSRAIFSANGVKLEGNKFKTKTPGSYKIVATIDTVESDVVVVTATPKEAALVLTSDKASVLAKDPKGGVTFEVKDKAGKVVTGECSIFVNERQIAGNKFYAAEEGEYKVIAKRGQEFSNELIIQANKMQDIILEADKVVIELNGTDVTTFKVYNKDREDLTQGAKITLDGNALESNVFKPEKLGKFKFLATYKGNKSNYVTVTVKEPMKYTLAVKVSKTTLTSDGIDAVSLRCVNTFDNDRDLTNDAEFFVDGVKLDKPYFTTTTNKSFKVTAKYKTHETSEAVTITSQSEFKPTPRMYMELFTGTWCPYCPRLITVMEKVVDHPQVVAVALHSGQDPFASSDTSTIGKFLNVTGYPTIILFREKDKQITGGTTQQVLRHIPENTPIGIAVYTSSNDTDINVDVTLKSSEALNNLKWVAMVVEDGLHADQNNAVYPDRGNPIIDMEHRAVYRRSHSSTVWGEDLSIGANETIKKSTKIQINKKWNIKNCSIYILIANASDNKVIAAQKVKVGSAAGY